MPAPHLPPGRRRYEKDQKPQVSRLCYAAKANGFRLRRPRDDSKSEWASAGRSACATSGRQNRSHPTFLGRVTSFNARVLLALRRAQKHEGWGTRKSEDAGQKPGATKKAKADPSGDSFETAKAIGFRLRRPRDDNENGALRRPVDTKPIPPLKTKGGAPAKAKMPG
jgi:hypothetical protein